MFSASLYVGITTRARTCGLYDVVHAADGTADQYGQVAWRWPSSRVSGPSLATISTLMRTLRTNHAELAELAQRRSRPARPAPIVVRRYSASDPDRPS